MNLVLNAVDALAGRDGEIGVRTGVTHMDKALLARCVTGSSLPAADYVFLEVSDTGSGMSPQVITKIFDPFFTTKVSGRGLGLAAVLGIIRGHNGALLVESEVGKGSTFKLFLPSITGESTRIDIQKEQAAREWHHGGDVLVIEDEEPVRVVLVELLKAVGFNAVAVPDGKSGVALFQQNAARWSLVVIDLLMPGMSGEATLGALRAISTDVRVLLVSGYSEDGILKRVSHDGRVAFLGKPFRQEAFEQTLRDLLK
jgi:CheY-like chemotaxis protein